MFKKVGQCRKQKATSCKLKNRVRASPLMVNCVTQILQQKLKQKQELTFGSNLKIRNDFKKYQQFGLLPNWRGGIDQGLKTNPYFETSVIKVCCRPIKVSAIGLFFAKKFTNTVFVLYARCNCNQMTNCVCSPIRFVIM